jgi:hypothetical protein
MINLQTETLLTFSQATKYLPRHGGKKAAPSTVYRWASDGHQGVKLEWLKLPGGKFTSLEAVERFAAALTTLETRRPTPTVQMQSQHDAAVARLRAKGYAI